MQRVFFQIKADQKSCPSQVLAVIIVVVIFLSAAPGSRALTIVSNLSNDGHVPVVLFHIGKPVASNQPKSPLHVSRFTQLLSPHKRFRFMSWPWVRHTPASGNQSQEQINRELRKVLAGMRRSTERLEAADVGTRTQVVQKQIIEHLDQLIKMAEHSQNANGGGRKTKSSEQQSMSLHPSEGAHPSPITPSQSARNSFIPGGGMMNPARMKQFISDHREWGNLPPRQRNMILNALRHQTLPRYKTLVRHYYEALAKLNSTK